MNTPSAPPSRRDERGSDEPLHEPESLATHPLGGPGGAIAGAAVGAVAGLAAGPVGALAGAVAGGAAGVMTGAAMGRSAEEPELGWWRAHHAEQAHASDALRFEDFEAAYRYGIELCRHHERASDWAEIEEGACAGWQPAKVASHMPWSTAAPAVRAAFDRERAGSGPEATTDLPG